MTHLRHQQIKDDDLHFLDTQERDACALICAIRKGGQATHGNVKRTIEALARMGHRTGYINGEGDGVGILTDIPRQLWTKRLAEAGLRSSLAADRNFWVAHVMIPAASRSRAAHIVEAICRQISEAGLHILLDSPGEVNRLVLGPNAEKNEPVFWQIAGINGQVASSDLDRTLFNLQVQLEHDLEVHFPSFSAHSVVYKVQGTVEILRRYYPELRNPDYASVVTLGHARYSTNTNPIFERAQPFGLIGHNGEFNTISRFRMEAAMLGIKLAGDNSDSQDVDRALQSLCMKYDMDLIEAMEYVFPPFDHDLIDDQEVKAVYDRMRQTFGPFAQGPAAVVARHGDLCVFSVDALGLRPLWFGETEKEYFATSERGVYYLDTMTEDPRPLAPGEKVALRIHRGHSIDVLSHTDIQRYVVSRQRERSPYRTAMPGGNWPVHDHRPQGPVTQPRIESRPVPVPDAAPASAPAPIALAEAMREAPALQFAYSSDVPWGMTAAKINTTTMAALGWERYHLSIIETIAQTGKEQIGSLGWDGPLAALSKSRVNIADHFKETVAVVTNPAIDRERERAQFSTRTLIGVRPGIGYELLPDDVLVQLETPLLLGGHPDFGSLDTLRTVANTHGTMTIEDLIAVFGEHAVVLPMTAAEDETLDGAIERLQRAAIEAVLNGAQCLVLDDDDAYSGENLWIDPLLVVSAVDTALRRTDESSNLRRRAGIVLRSGALRDLHDLALSIAFGANAVVPYALFAAALGIAPKAPQTPPETDYILTTLNNIVNGLTVGLQKVTSTIGCHELRGYGHSISSIGLAKDVAALFDTPNYFGSESRGTTWTQLKCDAVERASEFKGEKSARLTNPDRFYPKMWKKAESVARGEMSLEEYTDALLNLENSIPVSLRHVLGLKAGNQTADPASVDIGVSGHSMPVLISAMSFGSQGELAYKAYAEAAYRLNIICVNGEGGELQDIMGKYPNNRGQQIASARFGVNISFLNSCNLLEIKIGQGAKPGEGGHLPGFKVTEQVASARGTRPGVALISPSNNHDLYSIEDLAQLIDELKTANPKARVSVKIPVVPGVGIIAVGVAKAGADIITLTGYTGGTGAARAHSLRHVGLPSEIGVWLAHRALTESGLRDDVEIWCDGGMKSGRDVVKMMCLGANRVGFGTLAMVAVGCTICRGCQDGTCHVGITTHIKTVEEAQERGLRSFEPRDFDQAVANICTVFTMLGDDIRKWVAKLGYTCAQDLVGRADLLEQIDMQDRLDLTSLLHPVPPVRRASARPGGRRLTRPRNTLSKQISSIVKDAVRHGDYEVTYDDEQVMAMDRALGTHLSGAMKRDGFPEVGRIEALHLSFSNSAIPGNGLAAFIDTPLDVLVEGGAQDGVAKCAKGGTVAVLKGLNHNGQRLDGSVGKSFAYGAQGGLFIVQGNADSRACIRMSGADAIFGGEIRSPLKDHLGGIGSRSNLKGFAFEYMTSGRALVLGDPGPWMCAGMTGGTIYQRVQPEMGLTVEALERRIAKGAVVKITEMDEDDVQNVHYLLNVYIHTLEENNQPEAAEHLYQLLKRPQEHFVRISV